MKKNFLASALILVGGKSSRMGQDKALIPWQGIPMLTRVCQVASECCQQVYVLTPWQERYQDIITENCQFILETNPGQGPLVGLAEGMSQINTNWVLLLACDLPILEKNIIQTWINQLTDLPSNVLAFVPRQDELWQPMCGFYRRESLPELQKFIQQGGRSFQTWLSQVPVQAIPVSEQWKDMLFNCNTLTDLRERMKSEG
ncbi:MAG TPA: molybdenum cofactor guanylyltransferase [Leptolyngbyaceae cyanobacterium]